MGASITHRLLIDHRQYYRDRGRGGAGRAIALPLFCWDIFSRAPVDMEKVLVDGESQLFSTTLAQ